MMAVLVARAVLVALLAGACVARVAFGPGVEVDTNMAGACACALDDLDGDGNLDAVAVSWSAPTVAWWRNNGDGTSFGSRSPMSPLSLWPWALATGDLDNDGDQDVATLSLYDARLEWFQNNGQGVFQARTVSVGGSNGRALGVADLASKGLPDLYAGASAQLGDSFPENTDVISWFPHKGLSASASNLYDDEEVEYTAAQQTRDVASGDLDGDTHVDLVSVSASDGRVIWYRNRGFGAGFETRRIIADHGIVRDSTAVAVGDIDGDGFLDVITSSEGTRGRVMWFRNAGGAAGWGLATEVSDAGISDWSDVEVSDVDGDGDADVFAASKSGGYVRVFENLGGGSFAVGVVVTADAGGARSVAVADGNGDGLVDVLVCASTAGKVVFVPQLAVGPDASDNGNGGNPGAGALNNGSADNAPFFSTNVLIGLGAATALLALLCVCAFYTFHRNRALEAEEGVYWEGKGAESGSLGSSTASSRRTAGRSARSAAALEGPSQSYARGGVYDDDDEFLGDDDDERDLGGSSYYYTRSRSRSRSRSHRGPSSPRRRRSGSRGSSRAGSRGGSRGGTGSRTNTRTRTRSRSRDRTRKPRARAGGRPRRRGRGPSLEGREVPPAPKTKAPGLNDESSDDIETGDSAWRRNDDAPSPGVTANTSDGLTTSAGATSVGDTSLGATTTSAGGEEGEPGSGSSSGYSYYSASSSSS